MYHIVTHLPNRDKKWRDFHMRGLVFYANYITIFQLYLIIHLSSSPFNIEDTMCKLIIVEKVLSTKKKLYFILY